MARWPPAHHAFWASKPHAHLVGSFNVVGVLVELVQVVGGVLMGVCATALVVSLCSLCSRRRTRIVGDKLSSDDGEDLQQQQQQNQPQHQHYHHHHKKKKNFGAVNEHGLDHHDHQQQQHESAGGGAPQRSPVWQRAILMGERCQRPTFSGLILYDEKGNPLPRSLPPNITINTKLTSSKLITPTPPA